MFDHQPCPRGCDIRRKLAEELATAARLFSEPAVDLIISGLSENEYIRLRELAAAAQNRSEAALVFYEEQVDSRQCCAPLHRRTSQSGDERENLSTRVRRGQLRLFAP